MEGLFKKRVFISGIKGFTGVYLEKHFINKGYEVFGSVLKKPENNNHFLCDILNQNQLFEILDRVKPNYIIHLAAISFVASEDKQNIYNVNVLGTLNLLDVINKLNYNPDKILIASSATVYGNIEGELNEKMCPKPVNHYGNSKLAMENMIKSYFSKQKIIVTRPFNYTGVGQKTHFLIPKIVSHYKEKKANIELGNIDIYREFNDVDFVVECYEKLLLSNLDSEVVNICSGSAISIKQILTIMNELSGYNINVGINPNFVRKNEIRVLKGSGFKLNSVIGNFAETYSIQSILSKMYKSSNNNL